MRSSRWDRQVEEAGGGEHTTRHTGVISCAPQGHILPLTAVTLTQLRKTAQTCEHRFRELKANQDSQTNKTKSICYLQTYSRGMTAGSCLTQKGSDKRRSLGRSGKEKPRWTERRSHQTDALPSFLNFGRYAALLSFVRISWCR